MANLLTTPVSKMTEWQNSENTKYSLVMLRERTAYITLNTTLKEKYINCYCSKRARKHETHLQTTTILENKVDDCTISALYCPSNYSIKHKTINLTAKLELFKTNLKGTNLRSSK